MKKFNKCIGSCILVICWEKLVHVLLAVSHQKGICLVLISIPEICIVPWFISIFRVGELQERFNLLGSNFTKPVVEQWECKPPVINLVCREKTYDDLIYLSHGYEYHLPMSSSSTITRCSFLGILKAFNRHFDRMQFMITAVWDTCISSGLQAEPKFSSVHQRTQGIQMMLSLWRK